MKRMLTLSARCRQVFLGLAMVLPLVAAACDSAQSGRYGY